MGIMEKKMETTLVYRGYILIGIMEKKMETTIVLLVSKSTVRSYSYAQAGKFTMLGKVTAAKPTIGCKVR